MEWGVGGSVSICIHMRTCIRIVCLFRVRVHVPTVILSAIFKGTGPRRFG